MYFKICVYLHKNILIPEKNKYNNNLYVADFIEFNSVKKMKRKDKFFFKRCTINIGKKHE